MRTLSLLWLLLDPCSFLFAKQECPLPPALQTVSHSANIFSDQQESDLGDAIADGLARQITLDDEPRLIGHLQGVADQIVRYLPPNHFRFNFYMVELPEANAFSLPGGRVYIGRKMIALLRNDDELAGILAHELGHIVTHQLAVVMSQRFADVLKVNQVGDRADIFDKYHRFLESWRRRPGRRMDGDENIQYAADQVALYAMARAGFAPQAYVDFFDRFAQTHGKTGNWLSDIFGATKPDQRRLREILKSVSSIPTACADFPAANRSADFQKWQDDAIAYQTASAAEVLPGLVSRQALAMPLRPDIFNLRFSPNGKYVLAQDETGIHVLSRDPFVFIFFIEAADAYKAFFTPDSTSVVFYTPSLRVETWEIASHKRTSVYELVLRNRCFETSLSPDGNVLACLDLEYSLLLYDVGSGNSLMVKRKFYEPMLLDLAQSWSTGTFNLGYSPDGHYFLAGSRTSTLSFDLVQKRELELPSAIRHLLPNSFAFLGSDRIVGIDMYNPATSPVLRFPSGERLQQIPLANTVRLASPGHGDYILFGPLKEHPLGIEDLKTHKVIVFFKQAAGDIYDGLVLTEQLTGRIALVDLAAQRTMATADLSQSRLGRNLSITVSPDFDWLAVSTRTRGAVWNLARNMRVQYVRGFKGGWFGEDESFYADVPKLEAQQRSIFRMNAFGTISNAYTIGELNADQEGPYLVCTRTHGKHVPEADLEIRNLLSQPFPKKNVDVEVLDFRTQKSIWSHHFPEELPTTSWNPSAGTALLAWRVSEMAAQNELRKFSDLKTGAEKDDYFLELLELRSDTVLGKLLVKTNKGSFVINRMLNGGNWVVLSVFRDQVLTYSLSAGLETGHIFGTDPVLSVTVPQLAVTTFSRVVEIYDLESTQLKHEFTFPSEVAFKQFSPDGRRLFVFTRDQIAYVLDLTATFPAPLTSN